MSADHLGLHELTPVDLSTVVEAAALRRRVDRKYVVPVTDAARLLADLRPTHRVLQIGERRTSSYRSLYFDTADLRSCRDHLQGRRLRWKARSRLYVEDRLCRLEVKLKGSRGDTVKHSLDLPAERYGHFGQLEHAFVAGLVAHVPELRGVLEVAYTRATLADLQAGTRLTIDHAVVGRPSDSIGSPLRPGAVTFVDDVVVVETKGTTRLAEADRALHRMGHRPRALSKYAASAALLSEHLPDNDVRRLLGRSVRLQLA